MATPSFHSRLTVLACLAAALLPGSGRAQQRISLEDACRRTPPNYMPALQGQKVTVEGIVTAPVIHLRHYSLLSIQNSEGRGFMLESDPKGLSEWNRGDVVEASGEISSRAGLVVLHVEQIRKLREEISPKPQRMRVEEVAEFHRLGRLVEVEGTVVGSFENSGGDVLTIGDTSRVIVSVFLPLETRSSARMVGFHEGDKVRVVGFSSQYCPVPPHDRNFQILISDPAAVTLVERGWLISPGNVIYIGLALIWTLGMWWLRERNMAAQRRMLRTMTQLAEDVIASTTPAEISRKLASSLLQMHKESEIELYLFNRGSNSLDRVPTERSPEPLSVTITSPIGPLSSAVALCFRNRALLHIPDTQRSPLVQDSPKTVLPRSALFVPLFAQREIAGVLAVKSRTGFRRLKREEQMALQHLANQIAASVKLQEQQLMREQLLRSEKMAAAGQLISGVANELLGPLTELSRLADLLLIQRSGVLPEEEMREIAFQAHRGSAIVRRLLSFTRMEQGEARPLDVNSIVTSIMDFREHEWALKGVQARNALPVTGARVLADQAQFEQVLLNLLVHAEYCLVHSPEKNITVSSRTIGKRVQIWIDYSDRSPAGDSDPFTHAVGDALGLQVCQALMQSQGGNVSLHTISSGRRFEIDLPVYEPTVAEKATEPAGRKPVRSMTAVVLEPDATTQRKLLAWLSDRGHRAVPVGSAEEAGEMAQRLRFDVVFCAVRLTGVNWVELFERVRSHVGAFILLAEGYDSDLLRTFRGGEGYLLSKPVDEADLDNLLAKIEARQQQQTAMTR